MTMTASNNYTNIKTYDIGQMNQNIFACFFNINIKKLGAYVDEIRANYILLNNEVKCRLMDIVKIQKSNITSIHKEEIKFSDNSYSEFNEMLLLGDFSQLKEFELNIAQATKVDTAERALQLYHKTKDNPKDLYLYIFKNLEYDATN
jgi:hypothetical protein